MLGSPAPRGRGTGLNPSGRFELLQYVPDPDADSNDGPGPTTQFFDDASRSIVTTNDSPDVGFEASVNPYRGCEHACAYCYARPYHEYLGWSAGLDFEAKILVKHDAPELLRRELASPKWQPRTLGLSGVTDCYQPIERHLRLTRRCLEVLTEFRHPVTIVTKSRLVARDADLLGELARHQASAVFLSLTTLDADLAGRMEPRAARPEARLAAVRSLRTAGVPVGVLLAPLIPGLNDHELPALARAAAEAGAQFAGYTVLRLPHGVGAIFADWLERHYPDRKERVLGRVRALHGGVLDDPQFGRRMKGGGAYAATLAQLFEAVCRQAGLAQQAPVLSTASFCRPGVVQRLLFD